MSLHLATIAAKDGAGTTVPTGLQAHDTSGTGAGPFDMVQVLIDSTGAEILGTKADPANAATDTTAISAMAVLKQISKSLQGNLSLASSTASVSQTPTVSTSAYTSGNVIGGIMTFAGALDAVRFAGVLESLAVKFKDTVVTGNITAWVFKASPSNGTYTDHGAPTWNAADMANLLGAYVLTNQNTLGTMSIYNLDGIAKAMQGASASLFVVLTVSGTPTLASTSSMTVDMATLPG